MDQGAGGGGQRVVSRDCEACGHPISYRGRGRRPRYCNAACRQRAWALRTAERTLSAGADPRPPVVVEVIERERVVEVPTVALPCGGREWTELLATLAAQLADPRSPVAREHWRHRRIHDALVHAAVELGHAHPGGLERLRRR